jgi:hypothetical protein
LRLTSPFNLPAPGRRQCLYVVLPTSQTPVFLINSRLGRFSAARFSSLRVVGHLPRAPLLPKLRGHFAEFLLRGSLEHLRLLASPTCVRLRYGHDENSPARLFSAVSSTALGGVRRPLRHRCSAKRRDLPPRHRLPPCIGTSITRRLLRSRVPPQGRTRSSWYGNFNPFPIAYAFRPRLRDRLTRSG